ncbi:CLUMA_CG021150, isoform A [Clunio marinus]|uniref:CLUMA_CG021150, isoform A n=1 Tax=Clunio marinus TaxID=568069 RepID=A0A1J1J6H8_9DIPT|nr:CLUMA_CG021150, isoform A [Clunio marinus]
MNYYEPELGANVLPTFSSSPKRRKQCVTKSSLSAQSSRHPPVYQCFLQLGNVKHRMLRLQTQKRENFPASLFRQPDVEVPSNFPHFIPSRGWNNKKSVVKSRVNK